MNTEELLKSDLVTVQSAADALGMQHKRFMGKCMNNKLADPISDGKMVYGWSCAELAKSIAGIKSVTP